MSGRIAELEQRLERNPRDTLTRYVLAKDLLEAGQLVPAIEHLRELVRVKPDWMKAWILLAQGLRGQGQGSEARMAYEQALALARAQHHEGPEAEIRAELESLG